jgi:hypothetical protein
MVCSHPPHLTSLVTSLCLGGVADRRRDDDIKKLQNARAEMETWRSRCYQVR